MKIIFLDFDGVILTGYDYYLADIPNGQAIAALNSLISMTGAVIVVTSSWRLGEPVKELQERLTSWGVHGTVIGKTPVLWGNNEPRGAEISAFMEDYLCDPRNTIEGFVIIDDNADMANLSGYLVQTTPHDGLKFSDLEQCIDIINNKKAEAMVQ